MGGWVGSSLLTAAEVGSLRGLSPCCWDLGGQGWEVSHSLGEPVRSRLFFVSAAFLGTRRAAPHLLPRPGASSACGGGRPSGGRAALC